MQLFSADAILFSIFFALENIKKRPQKLLIIGPKLFFSCTGPAAQTSPELILHVINISQESSVLLSVVETFAMLQKRKSEIRYFLLCKCLIYKKRKNPISEPPSTKSEIALDNRQKKMP